MLLTTTLTGSAGARGAGSAATALVTTLTGSGGGRGAGSATFSETTTLLASGGARAAGSATFAQRTALLASGGGRAAGSATMTLVLPAPTSVTVTGTAATSTSVGFTLPATATGADVYRATSSGGPYSLIASNVTSPYADSPLSSGTTYYYRLASVNTAGQEGTISATYTAYAPPTSISSGSVTSSGATITFTVGAGPTGANIYISSTSSSGPWSLKAGNATSPAALTGLTSGTTYWYYLANLSASGIEGTRPGVNTFTTSSSGPAFRNSSSGDVSITAGGTFTVTKPAGTLSTDLVLLAIANNTFTNISTGPAGWTKLNHAEASDGTNHANVTLWWAAGSVSNLTFTDPNFFGTVAYGWVAASFSGANTVTQGGTNSTATSTGAAAVTAPALSSVHSTDMEAIALGAHNAGTWTATAYSVIQNAGVHQDCTLAYNLATTNSGFATPAVACSNSAGTAGQVEAAVNSTITYP